MAIKKIEPIKHSTSIKKEESKEVEPVQRIEEIQENPEGIDEKYTAENHVPTWKPEPDDIPVVWETDEKHNLPTKYDPDVAAR